MRIRFFTDEVAQAAADILHGHGFSARRFGSTVVTSCPTLWAVTVIDRDIGFDKVVQLDVTGAPGPRSADAEIGAGAMAGLSPERADGKPAL